MKNMNICFLIYNISSFRGSERATVLIANELSKIGYNVTILSLCGKNKCQYNLEKNIKLHTLYTSEDAINYKLKYFNILHKIYNFYKKNKIDISIDIFANMSLFTVLIKKFTHIKNITWEHSNFYSEKNKIKFSRRIASRYSDVLITLTKEDVEAYKKELKKINCYIDYIYNPTPFPDVEHSNLSEHNVITVGGLTYKKGYDLLLKSWKLVCDQNKDWKLMIIGEGEDKEKLIVQQKELNLDNVIFIGNTNDIQKYYKNASIFVSSSRSEGLPMCMIEAQSFGIPIVSFNCKTGPSEIIEDGKNGFLIENEDVTELANKLLILMNDRNTLLNFAMNSSIDKFRIEKIMKKWIDIIEQLK